LSFQYCQHINVKKIKNKFSKLKFLKPGQVCVYPAYPLFSESDEEKIIKICEETDCTVDYNLQDDMTGGGINLSQDIALAYIIADGCIERDMIENICTFGTFRVPKNDYRIILNELERQLAININNQTQKLSKVREQLKK
jgi:hypothetical protein